MSDGLGAWEAAGQRVATPEGVEVWCRRVPASPAGSGAGNPPLLALHGFPTCSRDWAPVLDRLAAERDVVLVDVAGFGLSDKPDRRYSIERYADEVAAVIGALGLREVDLLTHDMGDTIGGELLARDLDGEPVVSVRRRVVTNGSIYLELARLTDGQQLLLSLPDERLDGLGDDGGASFRRGVEATFAPGHSVDGGELDALVALAARDGGLPLLPRTIRYIEDRRAKEARYTGAVERHPSPLAVVWGALDPIAVLSMADRLVAAWPDAALTVLDDVGHYPMLEAPDRFADAVLAGLADP